MIYNIISAFLIIVAMLTLPACDTKPLTQEEAVVEATAKADTLSLSDRPSYETSQLTLKTATGQQYDIAIELAQSDDEKRFGLMFITELADDKGMLFIFDPTQQVAFWMKNTLIPLDMLFINKKGYIMKIVQNTIPESEDLIPSDYEIRAVLELNGGAAKRMNLNVGDQVLHPIFTEKDV